MTRTVAPRPATGTSGGRATSLAIASLRIRPFDPSVDFGPAAALSRIADRQDGSDWLPSEAVLRDEWETTARFDPATDVIVATADGEIVGLAETQWRRRADDIRHDVRPLVHPDWRGRGLGRQLLGEIEARAQSIAARQAPRDGRQHRLAAFFEPEIPGVEAFAAATGYKPHTFGFVMRRALDEPIHELELPAGLDVRTVRPKHHRAIWDADTEAFLDHAEPAERDEDDYRHWFSQTNLDTALWRVAWAGDEVAGSVMTTIWHDENRSLGVKRAWLEHVSVRRPWRGRGLASTLIADTLEMLRAKRTEEAMLGVHGENPTGAVGVYERAGFRVHRRWSLWLKPMTFSGPERDRASGEPPL